MAVETAPKTYQFSIPAPGVQSAGGPLLRTIHLDSAMFSKREMLSVDKDLVELKVAELKEELQARGEPTSGPKPMLQRRLHASMVRAAMNERHAEDSDSEG